MAETHDEWKMTAGRVPF